VIPQRERKKTRKRDVDFKVMDCPDFKKERVIPQKRRKK